MVSMTKRLFQSVFRPAWKEAFTKKNIASSFKKTGIWPYKPSLIFDMITKPLPIKPLKASKTPVTCRAVRRTYHVYILNPTPEQLSRIF